MIVGIVEIFSGMRYNNDMNMEMPSLNNMGEKLNNQRFDDKHNTKYESKSFSYKEIVGDNAVERGNVLEIWEDLQGYTLRMLSGFKEEINSGKYSAVIGLDSSGRVPTLLVSNIINEVYEQKLENRKLKTLFFSGKSRYGNTEDVSQQDDNDFQHLDSLQGENILLIDDFVQTGNSLELIVSKLQENGINYDIGVLAGSNPLEVESYDEIDFESWTDEKDYQDFQKMKTMVHEKLSPGKLVIPYTGGDIPKIYGQHQAGGVYKNSGAFSHAIPKEEVANLKLEGQDVPIKNIFRELIKEETPTLTQEFLNSPVSEDIEV